MTTFDPRLYLVTEPGLVSQSRLQELLPALVDAGVTVVQLRDKRAPTRSLIDDAKALKAALAPANIPLIVNDRVDVALAAGADGVHVGNQDMSAADVRRILGPSAIVGRSIERLDDLQHLDDLGAVDYVAVSPVFATDTKPDIAPPLGLEGVRAVRRRARVPVIGIGGVHAGNVASVLDAGADGIAVVSAVLGAPDPAAAARALRAVIDGGPRRRRWSRFPNVLTIAGSDSGGGAGIQADLKSFSALGAYGCSVVTAVTAQNTVAVTAIHEVPPSVVAKQLDAVFSDITIDAVKIGMLSSAAIIEVVADALRRHAPSNVVLDPVMVAKSGDRLLAPEAVEALRGALLPQASLLTPNLPEAGDLVGGPAPRDEAEMTEAGRRLLSMGPGAVLVKGGHLEGDEGVDVLVTADDVRRSPFRRIATRNTHGTGCSLSSAIAARLAHGAPLVDAVAEARAFLRRAIDASDRLAVGQGHGPVHHFHAAWDRHELSSTGGR